MHVLITGSAGFVGRHFAKYFLDAGDRVTGIDIVSNYGNVNALKNDNFRFIQQDCRDFFKPSYYHEQIKYDLVVHCAAIVGGRSKIDGDPLAVAQNLSIDAEFFRWVTRTGQQNVVYFSSSAAYPVKYQSLVERSSLWEVDINFAALERPDQTYGWAKLSGELLAAEARKQGINVYVFRPFSGYGWDQALDYPFPAFVQRAVRQYNPFIIWGDGKQTRDFIHIDDIVNAVMRAIELDIQEPINLGTGVATSFNQLALMCVGAVNRLSLPIFEHLVDKPTGVEYRVANTTKLNKFYKPQISLKQGIAEAVERRCLR